MVTKPRDDLPELGDSIAALHSSGVWYCGVLTVVKVDRERQQVEVRPEFWAYPGVTVLDAKLGALQWNLVSDLSLEEQAQMRDAPDPRVVAAMAERAENGLIVSMG